MTATIVINDIGFNLNEMKNRPKILIIGETKMGKTTLANELLEGIKRKYINGTHKIHINSKKTENEYNVSNIIDVKRSMMEIECEEFINENNKKNNAILIFDETLESMENIYLEKDMSIINIKKYEEYEDYEVNIGKYDYVFVLGKFGQILIRPKNMKAGTKALAKLIKNQIETENNKEEMNKLKEENTRLYRELQEVYVVRTKL
jgi:GTPase SAR1 family protein